MTPLRYLFVLLLLGVILPVHGQEARDKPGPKIVVREIWMHPFLFSTPRNNGSLEDFQRLAPGSSLLREPMEGYTIPAIVTNNGGGGFTTAFGMRFRDKSGGYSRYPTLRVGLAYNYGNVLRRNVQRNERIPFDTLSSMTTGEILFRDSVLSSGYDMSCQAHHLLLDIGLLFRTNPGRQWSFYGGIGIAAGASLQARTVILHTMHSHIALRTADGQTLTSTDFNVSPLREESYRMPGHTSLQGYIPLGVDLRVGTDNAILRKLHLFKEMRPGVHLNFIPDHGTARFFSFYTAGGIRLVWGE